MNPDGTQVETLATDAEDPAWSPDGRKIAFTRRVFSGPLLGLTADVWVMNADGTRQRTMTRDFGWDDRHPDWSPDGTEIAYTSNYYGGRHTVFVMHMLDIAFRDDQTPGVGGGFGPDQTFGRDHARPAWSASGPIAFASTVVNTGADGSEQVGWQQQLWTFPHWTGTDATLFRGGDALSFAQPDWSPDGTVLAYVRQDAAGTQRLGRASYPSGAEVAPAWPVSLAAAATSYHGLAWSPDGTKLAVSVRAAGADAADLDAAEPTISVMDADGTGLTSLGQVGTDPDWQPVPPTNSAAGVVAAGESVATNAAPTPTDPVGTTVTTPVPGHVSIQERSAEAPAPTGYAMLGQEVAISAPVASPEVPLRLEFRLDASVVPAGVDYATLQVLRNGVVLQECTGPAGTAAPDPCLVERVAADDGDVLLVALTSQASTWAFAERRPYAFTGFVGVRDVPALNSWKAGDPLPLAFSLGAFEGLSILAPGSPTARTMSCSTGVATSPSLAATSVGGLRYGSVQGVSGYLWAWRTERSWRGSCRELTMRLVDGSSHSARFSFR